MALMFQRLAHNYAKNGYFPTDSETTKRILNTLQASPHGTMRIADLCCGEGAILAECKHALGYARTRAYGIEYNAERAWHAKTILDVCIHADIHDCVIGQRQFGFMILNPPYGSTVADKSDVSAKTTRLEKVFFRRTIGTLQYGGVIALIIPKTSLDREYASWIARNLRRVSVYEAPEKQFKQIVILGYRQRADHPDTELSTKLMAIGKSDLTVDDFPEQWLDEPYTVPAETSNTDRKFYSVKIDHKQLAFIIAKQPCLWERMGIVFNYAVRKHRRPLRSMSSWHTALALAAGQISGVIKSREGRVFVVKGQTFKDKVVSEERILDAKGQDVGSKRILTDQFVPSILALDFTPGSETFGSVLIIK